MFLSFSKCNYFILKSIFKNGYRKVKQNLNFFYVFLEITDFSTNRKQSEIYLMTRCGIKL
jgi:hypothetical protein